MILLLSVLDICTVSLKFTLKVVYRSETFLKNYFLRKKKQNKEGKGKREKGKGKLLSDNLAV